MLPSADGTGGIAKRVDGVRMFLNGVALRSPVAQSRTVMHPPLPILIFAAFQTGRNADSFATVLTSFQEMCHTEMGYAVSPPPGIVTDFDRCFLNAMCRLWCDMKDYNTWLQFAWKLAVECYRLYEATLASLTAAAAERAAAEMTGITAALMARRAKCLAAIARAAASIPIPATTAAASASSAITFAAADQLGHGPILVPISCFSA